MKIQNVSDVAFKKYGRVHKGYSLDDIQKVMQHTPVPEDVVYVPSVEEMEELAEGEGIKNHFWRASHSDRILQWSQQEAERFGISSLLRNQYCSDRYDFASGTAAGHSG